VSDRTRVRERLHLRNLSWRGGIAHSAVLNRSTVFLLRRFDSGWFHSATRENPWHRKKALAMSEIADLALCWLWATKPTLDSARRRAARHWRNAVCTL